MKYEFARLMSFSDALRVANVQMVTEREEARKEWIRLFNLLKQKEAKVKALQDVEEEKLRAAEVAQLAKEPEEAEAANQDVLLSCVWSKWLEKSQKYKLFLLQLLFASFMTLLIKVLFSLFYCHMSLYFYVCFSYNYLFY